MRPHVEALPTPDTALLIRYREQGGYIDSYAVEVPAKVTLAAFVAAFYTSPVFKLERWMLRWAIAKPSTDAEAQAVAHGEITRFAAWAMEDRTAEQLLMRDVFGQTCSWFFAQPIASASASTRLWFGSAVVPTPQSVREGRPRMGWNFRLLLHFHQLYSRVLLKAAVRQLPRATAS